MTDQRDEPRKATLLVLSSTYPRWASDHEPGFVHELAKRLTARFRVIALAPHAPGATCREVLDGVEIVRFRYAPEFAERLAYGGGIVSNLRGAAWKCLLLPGFFLAQVAVAWRLVRRERVELMHAHWAVPQGIAARLVQALTGVPYVVTCHGSDLHGLRGRFWALLKRSAIGGARRVTTVSQSMQNLLPIEAKDAAAVIPMGIDTDGGFAPGLRNPPASTELLFVGRLVHGKGVDVLLRALSIARVSGCALRLTLVGDGPEAGTLRGLASELEIDGAVKFEGAVEHHLLPAFYKQAALLVAPYRGQEGLGLVLVEALACGCPVVTTRIDAVRDVFDGWPEIIAEPDSATSLAAAIVSATRALPKLRAQASAMHSALMAKYSWHASALAYSDLLAEALDQR